MNAIVEKLKNRSLYYTEIGIVNDGPVTSEKEKDVHILVKKRQSKTAIEQHIDDEIQLMLSHYRKTEKNNNTVLLADDLKLSQKIEWHAQLERAITPATIKSLQYANSFYDDSSTKNSFFKMPVLRYFSCFAIILLITCIIGFCLKETTLLSGYYSFKLTNAAIFYFIESYGITVACLGNLLYLIIKLSKQFYDITLTAERIRFYWFSLIIGVSASCFLALKIPELFLIEVTFAGNLFLGVISGLLVDIFIKIFRQ